MAERGESEGFALSPIDQYGARPKDSYFPISDASKSVLRENEAKYKRVKSLRVARQNRRRSKLLRSESSRSPSPIHRR